MDVKEAMLGVILVKEKQALYNHPWHEHHQTQEADLKRQCNERRIEKAVARLLEGSFKFQGSRGSVCEPDHQLGASFELDTRKQIANL